MSEGVTVFHQPGPSSFVPPSDSSRLASEIRTYLERHRGIMAAGIRGEILCSDETPGRSFSRAIDGVLSSLFLAISCMRAGGKAGSGISIGAVGSYGRRSLSYHSDLDIRILAEAERDALGLSEALLYPLWDAGVAIGHQGVTIPQVIELARTDLPTATSLLDWRPIAGDDGLVGRLAEKAYGTLFAIDRIQHFLDALRTRVDERIERYGGSVYLLEPDVRNGAGGMRDYDVVHWIARARYRVDGPRELVAHGVLIEREWEPIERASQFQWRVRNLLHLLSGRRNDRLSFERQEQVAEALGYGSSAPDVERFMSDYYRHARVLTQARDTMFMRAAPPSTRRVRETDLRNGLRLVNGSVALNGDLNREPALALRLYGEAVRRNCGVTADARTAVMQATSSQEFCAALRENPEAKRIFIRLVTWVARVSFAQSSVLGELHDVGLLTAMIPEFIPVVGRVHHDIYHVYTVDAHSIKALDRLRAFSRGELVTEHPIASHVAAEIVRPSILFFATLLHDIGKDTGGIHHGQRGAELIEVILARLDLSPTEIREVMHLVRKHLDMYHVATRRDIEDPLTLEEFCREVHGHEGLRELYLLTLCDVATTSPDALTSWKAKVIDELYLAAEARLGQADVSLAEAQSAVRHEVIELWDSHGDESRIQRFLQAMPERYRLAHEPAQIIEHARFVFENANAPAKVCALRLEPPYGEFAFLAEDRKGLLALIAASITRAHVEVVAAQIYSFTDEQGRPRALDLFWVHAGDRIRNGVALATRIEQGLLQLLELPEGAAVPGLELLGQGRWGSRVTPAVTTSVCIDNRGASRETILEVITRDRPGLLFELASTIQRQGLVISLAKINTEGHQVADVFYLAEPAGGKITDPLRLGELEARIRAAVGSG